jgi:KipI family sensor histidine kinase inhibitor
VRVLPYGPTAVLVELDSVDEVRAVHEALRAAYHAGRLPDVVELVPAARTVLVAVRPGSSDLDAVRAELSAVSLGRPPAAPSGEPLTVPVHYDGADLELVARTADLSTAEVVSMHTGADYTVAFCGFAPGFGYLTGLPEALRQPRLDTAREEVPAGSVGIADEFTGVYPRASPGGWRLLGRTDMTLFDPKAQPPAVLVPGRPVRFEAVS